MIIKSFVRKEAIVLYIYIKFEAIFITKIKGSDQQFSEVVLCLSYSFAFLKAVSLTRALSQRHSFTNIHKH